ncbi:MAG: 6-phosphogluconolactonase [Propionibacteriaceae bacterium]
MSPRVVRRLPNAEMLAQDVAESLVKRIEDLQAGGRIVELCLTGGRVANLAYEHLSRIVSRSKVDPGALELWWTDEAFVPTDDPRRNSLQALSRLAGTFPLSPSLTHPMPSSDASPDPAQAALTYGTDMAGRVMDICLLGVGENGHVAALHPDHPAAEPTSAVAVGVTDAPKPPPEQVSLSLATINRSREVWLLATGKEKADAVARTFRGDATTISTHVSGVDRTVWFLDEAAAAELPFHSCLL